MKTYQVCSVQRVNFKLQIFFLLFGCSPFVHVHDWTAHGIIEGYSIGSAIRISGAILIYYFMDSEVIIFQLFLNWKIIQRKLSEVIIFQDSEVLFGIKSCVDEDFTDALIAHQLLSRSDVWMFDLFIFCIAMQWFATLIQVIMDVDLKKALERLVSSQISNSF